MCGVTMPTIIDWIEQGKLTAYKTLGGHRRIRKDDLIDFFKKNSMPFLDEFGDAGRIKILIVDDDKKIAASLEKLIEHQCRKVKISVVHDGFEAGQLVQRIHPDIVLLDVMLPGIDGIRMCYLIKKYNKDTKIIVITGYHSDHVKKKVFEVGADHYFTKPLDCDALLDVIHSFQRVNRC